MSEWDRRVGKTKAFELAKAIEVLKGKPKLGMGDLTGGMTAIALASQALENMNPYDDEERTAWDYSYGEKKRNALRKLLKGGVEKVETKSRYEVISELESQKRNLIRERDGMKDQLKSYEKELKEMKREVEDKQDDIKEFKESMKDKETTFNTLIKSVDDSLNRFNKLQEKKK